MSIPKISYLVATFDTAGWLNIHLEHLITSQLDSNFEVIVIHHGSPGPDLQIGKKWAAIDSRIINIEDVDYGCYGPAWIAGWKVAKGEFVCNSNVDDFHDPTFTGTMYEEFTKNKNGNGFCYAGIKVINERGELIGGGIKPKFNSELYSRECSSGPQILFRNDEEFRQSLDWDLMLERAKQHHSAFDYWLGLMLLSKGYQAHVVFQPLTIYTQRNSSVENSSPARSTYESLASIAEFFPHNFDGHLKMFPEFKNFPNLPDKQRWIELRRANKKWRDE